MLFEVISIYKYELIIPSHNLNDGNLFDRTALSTFWKTVSITGSRDHVRQLKLMRLNVKLFDRDHFRHSDYAGDC